ncbi:hypothetical protein BDZ91DRAFT_789324 [Kalaharituber pfeilii]|nr:hypothetical protein BDZ91DRAFT_789324 [Kalaharituber pfeilii]
MTNSNRRTRGHGPAKHEATARGTPAQDTKGKGKTRVAPIELSTPIPSSPGNPGGMKSVVPCFDSLETTQFMNGAINASDWKGRIQVAWAQYFFVKRGLSADERKRCFHKLIPGELVSESKDLMAYYERTYSSYIEFLRGRVIKYGNMFFESPAGKLWMDELAIHKKAPCKVGDEPFDSFHLMRFRGHDGITFDSKETIDFYVKMLIHVKTDAARGSSTNPPKQNKRPPTSSPKARTSQKERLPQSGRAVVVHGIAVTKKLGKVREWMEKANPWMGKIVAARWLVRKERREGKKTSSIVIYLEGEVESDSQTPAKVRLSGKWYHSCLYDWDRITKVDRKGKGRDVEEMDMTA